MSRKNRPDWSARLTRSLVLNDGTRIDTLAEARGALLVQYFTTWTESSAVMMAMCGLFTAAETGSPNDRKAATDQVELVLIGPSRDELSSSPSTLTALASDKSGGDIRVQPEQLLFDGLSVRRIDPGGPLPYLSTKVVAAQCGANDQLTNARAEGDLARDDDEFTRCGPQRSSGIATQSRSSRKNVSDPVPARPSRRRVVPRETRSRNFLGGVFIAIFLAFNAFMIVFLTTYWKLLPQMPEPTPWERAGPSGSLLGIGTIVFFWVSGAVISGLLVLQTGGRRPHDHSR